MLNALPPTDAPIGRRLIKNPQAAEKLSVGIATWERMIAAGKTPAPIRLGSRLVRFDAEELDAWISAGCPARTEWLARKAATGKPSRN
jgi:excisionase family DNA binding protein